MRLDRLRFGVPLVAAFLLLSVAGYAAAEPVTLTSGSINYSRANQAEFRALSLNGIEIIATFGDEGSESWNPDHACFGCTPGTRINLSQSESFSSNLNETASVGGSIRVDDVDYRFDSMSFRINAGHINIPNTSNERSAFIDAGRFVFHGLITGTSDAGITRMFRLHGKGTATLFFGDNDWFSTDYKFAAASAAPVPEPGTLLLFGSGAVAAFIRRRRQRQHD